MSQNEKDILLEKFLAGTLAGTEKSAFEDLVRADDAFAGEVVLRLAEADAFHRAREAEKVDIRRRWRQRKWLRWAAWTAFILLLGLGAYWFFGGVIGNGKDGNGGRGENQGSTEQGDTSGISVHSDGGFVPTEFQNKLKDTTAKTKLPPITLCIHDKSQLNSIPPKPVAGQSNIRWETPFAAGKYEEALSAVNEYLSSIDTSLANDPRACAVGGALNICLEVGDPKKAVKYLEVVQKNKRYWEQAEYKSIKALLVFAYACTGDCGKARAIKTEQPLPADLTRWLDSCTNRQ